MDDVRYTPCPPTKEITPKAFPYAKDGIGMFVTTDFLYWMAHEDQLEYAQSTGLGLAASNASISSPEGKIYSPDWEWAPGFKVGAGASFCPDGWDVYAEYTWYHSNITGNTPTFFTLSNPALVETYWLIDNPDLGGTIDPLSSADAAWRLHLDVLDLMLGRNFYISPRLKLRPQFGLKGALEKQTMQVQTRARDSLDIETMQNRMRIWGIGILAGIDTAWQFSNHWSFTAKVAFTGLWERFHCSRFDDSLTNAHPPRSSEVHLANDFYTLKPVVEWMLGFRWETRAANDRVHLAFDAGWEEQIWFSQNQFIRLLSSVSNPGDLVLQGLTTKARIDF